MEVVLYTPESDITVYVCILVFYVFLPTVLLYGRHEDGDAEPAPLAKPSPEPEPEPAAAYEVSDLELTILTCLQDNEMTARHIVRALKDSWPDITRKDVNRCLYRLYGEGIVRKGGISWSMSP